MPWCLAVGLLVSFVADAGQDPTIGATRLLAIDAVEMPSVLIPSLTDGLSAPRGLVLPPQDVIVREARLLVGETQEIETPADEIEPKPALKARSKEFPAIDRSHKGDPNVGLRPTFQANLRSFGALALYRRSGLIFDDNNPGDLPRELMPPVPDVPGPESVARFEPLPEGITITTKPSQAAASPGGGLGGPTTPHGQDGSTPNVSRATALASATPVEPDSTPVQIAPLPKFSRGSNGQIATDTTVVMGLANETPAYSTLVDQTNVETERRCLAEAVYFEARSEPEEGQAAVAQVVLNRVKSGLYPQTICAVVFQNRQRHNACQFSFACEGRSLRVTEPAPWARAVRVANEVLDGSAYVSDVGGSTHYHANYVAPGWARRLVRMDRIGHHVFYKLRPGQT
jgi:spore germination cell wall hydrolase CwlJ-like protein